jgi:hypothetical protein
LFADSRASSDSLILRVHSCLPRRSSGEGGLIRG